MTIRSLTLGVALALAFVAQATAAEMKVLTAGAFKQVLVAIAPAFERESGHRLEIVNDTVGALAKRIREGEAFDLVVVSPAALDDLAKAGKLAGGARANLARVGVGVMVRAGAPKPDIATVEAFKRAVLAAQSVAYIDPESGGSSGIYLAKLFERLGIADAVKPKAKLKRGGYVADLVKSGEAELGIHQISEIVPVKEVTLVGPLPAEIQNYTTYAAGISAQAREAAAAQALLRTLTGPATAAVLQEKGMEAVK
ncbi:MAG: substrate-binding domain-containing protein [Variibacter sp.]|nr:substrate-binding domain-containing protein [Variibacter sp.]